MDLEKTAFVEKSKKPLTTFKTASKGYGPKSFNVQGAQVKINVFYQL